MKEKVFCHDEGVLREEQSHPQGTIIISQFIICVQQRVQFNLEEGTLKLPLNKLLFSVIFIAYYIDLIFHILIFLSVCRHQVRA